MLYLGYELMRFIDPIVLLRNMNTTKPEDLEESTFTKYDVKAGRSIGVDNNVSVA